MHLILVLQIYVSLKSLEGDRETMSESNLCFLKSTRLYTLVSFLLLFGKKPSGNQGKLGLFYGQYSPVSAIHVAEILKVSGLTAPPKNSRCKACNATFSLLNKIEKSIF